MDFMGSAWSRYLRIIPDIMEEETESEKIEISEYDRLLSVIFIK
jgi:hypothetical protein